MSDEIDIDAIISGIIKEYPEKEWLKRSKKALPGVDDFSIMESIEILNGGDVRVVGDDGSEHGLFV